MSQTDLQTNLDDHKELEPVSSGESGGHLPRATIPLIVVWPKQGDNIRIWSLLSRQSNGFWQVKKKLSSNTFQVDGKGTYDSNSKFRFYVVPEPEEEEEEERPTPSDSTPVQIGIPGNRIGNKADSSKIYMLQWTKSGIQAKGFPAPADPTEPPVVTNGEDQLHMTFRLQFNAPKTYYTLRDYNALESGQSVNKYMKTENSGTIDRVAVSGDDVISTWSTDPGLQYYLSDV